MKTFLAGCLAACLLWSGVVSAAALSDKEIRERYYRSYQYERTQNYDDAIKSMLILQQSYPQGYTINLRLAWLYYLKGYYANSEKRYKEAIKLAPTSIEARLGYMLPLMARNQYEQAETVGRRIVQADPANFYGNLRLAIALRRQKKHDQAERILNGMLTLYPTDVSYLTQLGLVKIAQGKNGAARRLFRDILLLDPENVTAKEQLAKIRVESSEK